MTANNTLGPVEAYGDWLALAGDNWPADARHSAHREFIDVIAVMVPGALESAAQRTHDTVRDWGSGRSAVAGHPGGLAAPWAALVNGTAAHALDFDDNFDPPKAHATTVLAPAILALGDEIGASGAAVIDAYIVGLQIMGRVGQGVNPTHRNRGWHATATLGAVGAAAACARLLKLNPQAAATALSISTSMAAGFMSQFGTMTKPLHAGLAAKAGVMAAALAKSGLSASMTVLDGRTGMNHLMVGPDYEQLRDNLTHVEHGQNLRFETENVGAPLLITEHGFRVKRFANCGASHRAMDAVIALRQRHGFAADDVAAVEVFAPRVHFNNLMYTDPLNGLEAKFSMEYALALCLHQGDARLGDFTDQGVARPQLRRLFGLIHRRPVDKLEGEFPTRVEVKLHDGRHFSEERAWPLGSKAAPFSDAEYWAKYDGCVAGILPDAKAQALKAALGALPELDSITQLTRHLRWGQE